MTSAHRTWSPSQIQALHDARRALATRRELWRSNLLDCQQLGQLATKLDISDFSATDIHELWRIGLLRAELVVRFQPPEGIDLEELPREPDCTDVLYADLRTVCHRQEGYGQSINQQRIADHSTPYFHPYRFFVLHEINRVFDVRGSSKQFLQYPNGFGKVIDLQVEHLKKWTSKREFADLFDFWNRLAELSIASAPPTQELAHGGGAAGSAEKDYPSSSGFKAYAEVLNRLLLAFDISHIEALRGELGRISENLDGNKLLKVLIRKLSAHERSKIRGRIGAAMSVLSMAESIRRTAEIAFKKNLKEEDEIGFGHWYPGARKTLYGTDRIFDADFRECADFLTSMGIGTGIKARVYVEGETEMGALTSALGDAGPIQLVNLSGLVIERGRKGLAFSDSLRSDIELKVFSIVLIDGDVEDSVRALKRAAQNRDLFGFFYLSYPDFEFGNFSISELITILSNAAAYRNIEVPPAVSLAESLKNATSGKEIEKSLSGTALGRFIKTFDWGVSLWEHANSQPILPNDHRKAGQERPVVSAVKRLRIAPFAGYDRSFQKSVTDPETGQLVDRC